MKDSNRKQHFWIAATALLWCVAALVACSDDDDDEYSLADEYATEYVDGHGAVDLGLSVMWASCNVGASSPYAYGKYYAWGEVKTKSSYDIDNSTTYGVSVDDISSYSSNDVATANWGDAWRMPTEAECEELINDCTWEWTTVSGKNGYLVTGPSGSSIFLPAAGWYAGESLNGAGSYGSYWSSTPDDSDTQYSGSLDFADGNYDMANVYRYYGETIRPVTEEE